MRWSPVRFFGQAQVHEFVPMIPFCPNSRAKAFMLALDDKRSRITPSLGRNLMHPTLEGVSLVRPYENQPILFHCASAKITSVAFSLIM